MAGGRLGWYASRLRTMGPREVAWRLGRLGVGVVGPALDGRRRLPEDPAYWERALADFRRGEGRAVLLDRDRARRIAVQAPDEVAGIVAAAERVLRHRVTYFGYPEAELARPVDWHHDPVRGFDWPRLPAARIDHRTAPADPKWIWELNRLQHLPWLAQAWLVTGRDEFADEAFAQLDSWLDQCPVGHGIAWRGAFEAGVRIVSVLVALQGLRDSPLLDVDRFRRVVGLAEASARICWRERSLHSSANNHLVGELAGLAVTALLLPDLPRADRWGDRALAALAVEADRQVLPDGAGAEQAVGYQVFTAELMLVVMLAVRSAGAVVPPALEAGVRRSADYLAAVVGTDDPEPRYGDDDEGFALRLGSEPVRTVRDHLTLVASYGAPAPVPGSGLAARWVQAASADGPGVRLRDDDADADATPAGSRYAPHGGLAVLRPGGAGAGERLTVDVGPLGYLAIAAHGHADALAVTWSRDGRDVVVDPGTGSYYGHPDWRRAHRGTAVHATVTVDGEDQSVMAGAFLWSQRAEVTVHEVDLDAGVVDAEHDGYTRLADPVRHRRRVVAPPGGTGFVVLDVIRAAGAHTRHTAAVGWPLAPDLVAETTADGFRASRDGEPVLEVRVAATAPVRHGLVLADPVTHRGWWSGRLERRVPAPLLTSTVEGTGVVAVVTVVRPVVAGRHAEIMDLAVETDGERVVARWTEEGSRCVQELHKTPGEAR